MDNNNKYIAAIDLGTTKIVAMIGKRNTKGNLEILGMGKTLSVGIKRGMVQNIEKTVSSIKTAIELAEKQAGVKIKDAYVGIAGQHIKSIKNRGYLNKDFNEDEISNDDVQTLINDMYKMFSKFWREIFV